MTDYLSYYQNHLPPYRSLLSPNTQYDYVTHQLIHSQENDPPLSFPSGYYPLSLVKENTKKRFQMKYKSLLQPINTKRKKLMSSTSDSFSIHSIRSTMNTISNVRAPPKSLESLPTEVLSIVMSYVDDRITLIHCLYVSKKLKAAVTPVLYRDPYITSTYRLAQFVYTLLNHQELALHLKSLDLSKVRPGVDLSDEGYYIKDLALRNQHLEPLAGWRDWKFRDHPVYGARFTTSSSRSTNERRLSHTSLYEQKATPFTNDLGRSYTNCSAKESDRLFNKLKSQFRKLSQNHEKDPGKVNYVKKLPEKHTDNRKPFSTPHPLENSFFSNYWCSKDIPIGYIIHLLQLCPNLKFVDFSGISLSHDYQVLSFSTFDWQTGRGSNRIPVHSTMLLDHPKQQVVDGKPIFLSDTVYSMFDSTLHVWEKVTEKDIIANLLALQKLEVLRLRRVMWLESDFPAYFLENCAAKQFLSRLDIEDSGMAKGLPWARNFNVDEWRGFFQVKVSQEEEERTRARVLEQLGENY
ncbi:Ciclopirox olamine resistance protein [Komagataella phaffii CBS 7435]|uniref:Ciclopirox olamine resistance protein n=1 Tax=Komagataella phaffii (strain ATCC 76273 / CBS 7435 / CECT 11047 / NRRL Y-11430 / Wegner 21-1) TaxID=981350 RepID=F2QY25_KOMPC|nr:GQ67_05216T0 [Komagataella phaffii]CAH2450497.1 Ciclopirox olamine resistance protein [Komagataella phaffii CBS 7435]CCA40303.1 Ciclopirox olamine resistance protein [Komagataella phaffii CBS 7435]